MSNHAVQLAQKSRELTEARRLLELGKADTSLSQEEFERLEDDVYDLEDEIEWLEDQIEADEASEREGRHGWA